MAKRTSNRAARRLLLMPFWFSNRKQMSGWPSTIRPFLAPDKGKPSRRQRRAEKVNKRIREELRQQRERAEGRAVLWPSQTGWINSFEQSEKPL